MDSKLKNGMLIVFITNVINLMFSLITNFILPRFLSIDTYAGIKEFQLYMSYIGLLHFGYVDGVYLRWGGKEISEKDGNSFKISLVTLEWLEIVISLIIAATAVALSNSLLLFFALSVVPVNVNSFYKYLYQATGNFDKYGCVMNLSTIATFFMNVAIVFWARLDNYQIIILLYVMLYYIVWIVISSEFKNTYLKHINIRPHFSISELRSNVGNGFFLTVGNLASLFLSSMDRWFVKVLLYTSDFAFYSFAVSVEGMLNIAITPVTTTLYNFFCREKDNAEYVKITSYVVLFSTLLPLAAFPVELIIDLVLVKYKASETVIVLLFASQMICFVINSVFVNLYKARRQQKTYFVRLVTVLLIGFILNALSYNLIGTNDGFAVATLVSSSIWLFFSFCDFKDIGIKKTDILYLLMQVMAFVLIGFHCGPIAGCILYLIVCAVFGIGFMKEQYKEIFLKIRSIRMKVK